MEAIAILFVIAAVAFFVFSIGGFDDLIMRHIEMRKIHEIRREVEDTE